jgi:uncharacterized protein (DUF433 family)
MDALEEARTAVERLNIDQRQELLNWIYSGPIKVAPGIYRTPGVCGGDACVRGFRLPVWQLEEARLNGATDSVLLEAYPDLTPADLANAWAYVQTHRREIERAIRENKDV